MGVVNIAISHILTVDGFGTSRDFGTGILLPVSL